MNFRNIIAILLVLFIGVFIFSSCPSSTTEPCDLTAPENAYVTIIDSTTAEVFWTPVDSAAGYQLTVLDSFTNNVDTFIILGGQDTSYVLTNLIYGRGYGLQIAALCEDESNPSINSISIGHIQSLIVEDVVILAPLERIDEILGMNNCDCSIAPEPDWSDEITENTTIAWETILGGEEGRRVFEFIFSDGTESVEFKMSFLIDDDPFCPLITIRDCTESTTVTGFLEGKTLEVEIDGSTAEITSQYPIGSSERELVITLNPDPGCIGCSLSIRYRDCHDLINEGC